MSAYPIEKIMILAYQLIPLAASGNKLKVADLLAKLPDIENYNRENVRRQIRRVFTKLNEDAKVNDPLIIDGHSCCWKDAKSRDIVAGQYSETPESKAIVYYLMSKHLRALLPPKFRKELEMTYDRFMREASNKKSVKSKVSFWQEALIVNPLGFPLFPSESDENAYGLIYNAVENKLLLQATYQSIHAELKGGNKSNNEDTIIFSPHKIILQNMQLYALATIHQENNVKILKLLSLNKLKDVCVHISRAEAFAPLDMVNFSCSLTLRIHDYVKDYFDVVKLSDDQQFERDGKKCWIMRATVQLPQHFRNTGADVFYLCNFLGSFSHAVEVIRPLAVREEMKKRAGCMLELYNSKGNGSTIMDNFVGKLDPFIDEEIVKL